MVGSANLPDCSARPCPISQPSAATWIGLVFPAGSVIRSDYVEEQWQELIVAADKRSGGLDRLLREIGFSLTPTRYQQRFNAWLGRSISRQALRAGEVEVHKLLDQVLAEPDPRDLEDTVATLRAAVVDLSRSLRRSMRDGGLLLPTSRTSSQRVARKIETMARQALTSVDHLLVGIRRAIDILAEAKSRSPDITFQAEHAVLGTLLEARRAAEERITDLLDLMDSVLPPSGDVES